MEIIKRGDRVICNDLYVHNITGTVRNVYPNEIYPVEVELDKPYDDHGHTLYRFGYKEALKIGGV